MIYLLAALSLLALGATAALLYLKGDKAKMETENAAGSMRCVSERASSRP